MLHGRRTYRVIEQEHAAVDTAHTHDIVLLSYDIEVRSFEEVLRTTGLAGSGEARIFKQICLQHGLT